MPYANLTGTTASGNKFRLGSVGLYLSSVSAKVRALLSDGITDAPLVGSKVSSSGDLLGLNEDATGSGADWTMDIARPATGMTGPVTITLPPDLAPSIGFALVVDSVAAGVVTLKYKDDAKTQSLTSGATVASPGTGAVAVTYTANNFCQFVFTHGLGRRFAGATVYSKAALTGVVSTGSVLNPDVVVTSTTVTITFYGNFADLSGIGTGTQGSALEIVYV